MRGGGGNSATNGSGGAGGGGFGSPGGSGGSGSGGSGGAGGMGGQPNGSAPLVPLRGGCPGGTGGDPIAPNGGRGGPAGGAVQLSAARVLMVSGAVAAPGGGGRGADGNERGGGGGGSGGAVLLEGRRLTLAAGAFITANGGSGGEGSGTVDGNDGQEGLALSVTAVPGGGGNSQTGGEGGAGGSLMSPAADGGAGVSIGMVQGGGGGGQNGLPTATADGRQVHSAYDPVRAAEAWAGCESTSTARAPWARRSAPPPPSAATPGADGGPASAASRPSARPSLVSAPASRYSSRSMLKLGRFELHEVRDGTFALDGGAMFGVVPKAMWERKHPADERNRVQLALRCLLIVDGKRRVLVDDGIGSKWDGKHRDLYAIDHSKYDLDRELARAGFTRGDITDVVLTHLHFDHAGGTTRLESGQLELSFPNATYHLQRRNWAWAHHPTEKDKGSFRAENYALLENSGRLHLLEGQTELYPGIQLFVSEGHTVGLQLLRVTDGDESLVFCGDLIPTTSHFRPSWAMAYDLYPLTVIEEKKMILAQAVEDGSVLFFEHDPAIAACTVKEERGEVVVDRVVAF